MSLKRSMLATVMILVASILVASAAGAADYLGAGPGYPPPPDQVLRIGPGHAYGVVTPIRAGTSPKLKFCEYRGKWCYGAYGRYDGWVFVGPHPSDHWFRSYLLGH